MEHFALSVKNINKFFYKPKKFRVLNDISFNINKGEFLALIGKSGSGKSTLLYVLSTMDTDFSGELFINGKPLNGKSQNKLSRFRNEHIGFVFQFHYLLPEFTALENVMLPALKLGKISKTEIKEKALYNLDLLGIKNQAYKLANKLSGGQQQRVAIARALINDPAVLMCDEPTGNLDTKNTKIVFDIFKKICQENGQTIIAVTHDEEFAKNCSRIIELEDGQLLQ